MQIERLVDLPQGRDIDLEDRLSIRQEKDMRCVVLCKTKSYAATEHAHLGRLYVAHLVERLSYNRMQLVRFQPSLKRKDVFSVM